jgi:hypothetical protein
LFSNSGFRCQALRDDPCGAHPSFASGTDDDPHAGPSSRTRPPDRRGFGFDCSVELTLHQSPGERRVSSPATAMTWTARMIGGAFMGHATKIRRPPPLWGSWPVDMVTPIAASATTAVAGIMCELPAGSVCSGSARCLFGLLVDSGAVFRVSQSRRSRSSGTTPSV